MAGTGTAQAAGDWEDVNPGVASPSKAGGDDEWEDVAPIKAQTVENKPESQPSALSRFGSGIVDAAESMIPKDLPSTKDTAIAATLGPLGSMGTSAYHAYKQARAENQPVYASLASGAGSMLGLNPEGIRERASKGDIAGIAGEAVPSIATTLLGGEREAIGEGAGAAKDTLGRTLRTPEGKLKPLVRGTARVAGGLAGSSLGTGGTIIGGLAGPSIADAVIPEHPYPSGWSVKLPGRMPRTTVAGRLGAGAPVPDVNVVPEPRAMQPGDRPGSMFSVPRTVLPGEAARGTPGAADVLRNIGKTVIYEPPGVGYGGARPESVSGTPQIAYRARPIGQEGIPSQSHAQATLSEPEARQYSQNLEDMTGKPHEVVKVDLGKAAGKFTQHAGPSGSNWIKFNEDMPESVVESPSRRATDQEVLDRYNPDMSTSERMAQLEKDAKSPNSREAKAAQTILDYYRNQK